MSTKTSSVDWRCGGKQQVCYSVCVWAQCWGVVLYVRQGITMLQTWQLFMTGTWHGNRNQLLHNDFPCHLVLWMAYSRGLPCQIYLWCIASFFTGKRITTERREDCWAELNWAECFCFYDLSKMLPNKKRVDSKHIVRMGPECYNSSRDNIIYGGYYISDMTYPGRRQRE